MPASLKTFLADAPQLTGRGRRVLLAAIIILVIGLVMEDPAMIRIALCWILLIIAALPFSYLNMSRIHYARTLPDAVYKGESFFAEMSLRNDRKHLEAFDIEVHDQVVRRSLGGNLGFQAVSPGQTDTLLESTRINRRGVFRDYKYELVSQFPLGLACFKREGVISDPLVVYPLPKLSPDIRNLLESECGFGRSRHNASSDATGEFRSMREYQPGDHAKLISWPASTRFQNLIVKEMEHPGPQEVTVIFHSYRPPGTILTRRSFERSLQLLSGLFIYLYNNYIPFSFVSSFNRWNRMTIPAEARCLRLALESLAAARLTISKDITSLANTIERASESSISVIVVSNTPTRHWESAVPPLSVPVLYMDNSNSGVVAPELMRETQVVA